MVELRTITPANEDAYFARTWNEYGKDIVKAGMTAEQARINIEQTKKQVFENGLLKSNQHLLNVFLEGKTIGVLWLVNRTEVAEDDWYIYDIEILQEFRGQGLGKATMLAAEKYVMAHGGHTIGLNVFGFNTVARKLYESLDYETNAIQMKKKLLN
ncbi:MAG: GNAT family N-acetyltransferase [Actinomycetes bacterium]